jgi:septum formation protein
MFVANHVKLTKDLVLASKSPARRALLASCGLLFTVSPSHFDETAAKQQFAEMSVASLSLQLARGKAALVSQQQPDMLVLAADQIAFFDGQILGKPKSVCANIEGLKRLRGQQHQQHSSACIYLNGTCLATFHECIDLHMHDLSDQEISDYVAQDQPMQCCAGYRFEGRGRWLFSAVQGSSEGVMGLPLMPILNYLRTAGWVDSRKAEDFSG